MIMAHCCNTHLSGGSILPGYFTAVLWHGKPAVPLNMLLDSSLLVCLQTLLEAITSLLLCK